MIEILILMVLSKIYEHDINTSIDEILKYTYKL